MRNTEKVLKEELSKLFEGQSQRLTMLSKLIIAILKLGTVSYSKLCLAINPSVKKDSNFKRIQRFMKEFNFSRKGYIKFAWRLFADSEQWIALTDCWSHQLEVRKMQYQPITHRYFLSRNSRSFDLENA